MGNLDERLCSARLFFFHTADEQAVKAVKVKTQRAKKAGCVHKGVRNRCLAGNLRAGNGFHDAGTARRHDPQPPLSVFPVQILC